LEFFEIVLLKPTLNILVVLSNVFFHDFGLAIIVLTILVRGAMLPLTLKQLRSSKKMSDSMREIQPRLQQIKKKFAKDPKKLQQETMKLYKEAGVSPMGCLSSPMLISMLIQIPIFIAVYRAIIQALAVTPQDFLGLSQDLYSWSIVHESLPVSGTFLWLNLGSPDPYLIIPILVMVTMWISQKMITQPSLEPQQQSMQNMMQLMMPLMFGFITFSLPAGLGLYFVVTSLFSIATQYFVYGWGNLSNPFKRSAPQPAPAQKPPRSYREEPDVSEEEVEPGSDKKEVAKSRYGGGFSRSSKTSGTKQRKGSKYEKHQADITVDQLSDRDKGGKHGKSRSKR